MKMGSVALTVLSMTIGFFFIFVGTLKLTPSVNTEVYKEMRRSFIRNAKVFPFVKQTGWKPNPHVYRKVIGTLEVVCGVTLVVIPGPLKDIANVFLLMVMLNDIYTHYALQEGLDRMTPAIVFLLLLACRLVIHIQVKSRDRRTVFDKQKPFPERAEPTESSGGDKKQQ
ncbi:novel acetylcholine receptor chaperone-like [Liolophura sinensis]|uniref:novel acetylcholine receptor chaperone-like n=1 Tax=Liolophura sinensis TaxID=3198878 RepID=UPI0031588C3B